MAGTNESHQTSSINDLPDEILEIILSLTSPYRDFKSAQLVCHRWNVIVSGVIKHHCQQFQKAVESGNLVWSCHQPGTGPMITERYSHSACYYNQAIYIFGGCTSTATTFNDLWKFDLTEERWFRPLATGSYPSPKAWASMVVYKDSLVLFGGWSYPTPITFHQASRFFNQLHLYNPGANDWTQVTSHNCPEGKAGHGANVIGDSMIVFGGSHGFENSCNDVLILNLKEMSWKKQSTTEHKPRARYNHSQLVIDNNHILILGGCGGANMQFSDAWLLTLTANGTGIWCWQELSVANPELAAPQLWCHPACKVGNKVIILSKNPKVFKWDASQSLVVPTTSKHHVGPRQQLRSDSKDMGRNSSRASCKNTEPHNTSSVSANLGRDANEQSVSTIVSASASADANEQNASAISASASADANEQNVSAVVSASASADADASADANEQNVSAVVSASASADADASADASEQNVSTVASDTPHLSAATSDSHTRIISSYNTNNSLLAGVPSASASTSNLPTSGSSLLSSFRTGLPCIRPNAMKNRKHQLETLKKYEEKFRTSSLSMSSLNKVADCTTRRSFINPTCIHTVDISDVLITGSISWLPVRKPDYLSCPEETIFYSLVEGRGELILFGGIRGDLHTMQRGLPLKNQAVSNTVYYLSFMKHVN